MVGGVNLLQKNISPANNSDFIPEPSEESVIENIDRILLENG